MRFRDGHACICWLLVHFALSVFMRPFELCFCSYTRYRWVCRILWIVDINRISQASHQPQHRNTLNEMSNDGSNKILFIFSLYRFIRTITITYVSRYTFFVFFFFLWILLLCCLCARQWHAMASNWKRISFDSFLLFKFELYFRFFVVIDLMTQTMRNQRKITYRKIASFLFN